MIKRIANLVFLAAGFISSTVYAHPGYHSHEFYSEIIHPFIGSNTFSLLLIALLLISVAGYCSYKK